MVGDGSSGSLEQLSASTRPHFKLVQGTGQLQIRIGSSYGTVDMIKACSVPIYSIIEDLDLCYFFEKPFIIVNYFILNGFSI